MPPGHPGAGELCQLHAELGSAYADAFEAAADELAAGQADLAVLHGQTFYHWVDGAGRALGTLQLGNSAEVAERTGLPVICDLRSRDLVAGGQAAPLVAMFDQLLLAGRPGPSAAVNLGGIANLTVVEDRRVLVADDIGPAGALMDPAASWASAGSQFFNALYLRAMLDGIAPEPAAADVSATVTRLLVDLLAGAAEHHGLTELVLSGGGSSKSDDHELAAFRCARSPRADHR